jgi:hypothetical protein
LQGDELHNPPQQGAAEGQRRKANRLAQQRAHAESSASKIIEQPYGYQAIEDLVEYFLHVEQIQ